MKIINEDELIALEEAIVYFEEKYKNSTYDEQREITLKRLKSLKRKLTLQTLEIKDEDWSAKNEG